jgi:hypothetical protein
MLFFERLLPVFHCLRVFLSLVKLFEYHLNCALPAIVSRALFSAVGASCGCDPSNTFITGIIPTLSLYTHIYIASLFYSYSINSVLHSSSPTIRDINRGDDQGP